MLEPFGDLSDLRHDIVYVALSFVLGKVWAGVSKAAKDLNHAWEQIRCFAERIEAIEKKLDISCEDSCPDGTCKKAGEPKAG